MKMEEILDATEDDNKPVSNYKRWAFRLFVYTIITNGLVFYKIVTFASGFHSPEILNRDLLILGLVGNICVALGSIFTILSYRNQEEKNYQYKVSIVGYPFLIACSIVSYFFL